jgi:hypothetical protein
MLLGRQRELSLGTGGLEGRLELGPEICPLPFQLERVVEHPERARGQVVGHRLEAAGKEARQDGGEAGGEQRVVLRAGLQLVDELAQLPGRDLHLVGGCTDRCDGRLAAGVIEDDLAGGTQRDLGELRDRALRLGIEAAQALDVVAEELDADGAFVERRPYVEDSAPHRESARVFDERDLGVAGGRELLRKLVAVLRGPCRELQAPVIERLARQHPAGQAPHGGHDDPCVSEMQVEEPCDPGHRDAGIRGETFVRQHLVPGKPDDNGAGRLRSEEAQVLFQRLGRVLGGNDADERQLQLSRELPEGVAAGSSDQTEGAHLPRTAAYGVDELGHRGWVRAAGLGEGRLCDRLHGEPRE